MARYIKWVAAATLAFVGLTVGTIAEAAPIHVSIGLPQVVVSAPAVTLVAARPLRPSPSHVWVQGSLRHDAFGHQVWVPAHWKQPALVRTAVVSPPGHHRVSHRQVTVVRR